MPCLLAAFDTTTESGRVELVTGPVFIPTDDDRHDRRGFGPEDVSPQVDPRDLGGDLSRLPATLRTDHHS